MAISALICAFMMASCFQALEEEKATIQTVSFKLIKSPGRPQIAIWIIDNQGTFIDTVYVTKKPLRGLVTGVAHC